MALLRNFRNMRESGVEKGLVASALLEGAPKAKALPFRFISAERAVPEWSDIIEEAMLVATDKMEKLAGKTRLIIDVSGSMDGAISQKSTVSRWETASALAILCREICRDVEIFTFSDRCVRVKPYRGFALRDVINRSQAHRGTELFQALDTISVEATKPSERAIIITDEQADPGRFSYGRVAKRAYVINVGCYENGVGYGSGVVHISGWSDAVIRYIAEIERFESEGTR